MPAYNSGETISEAIASVLRQTDADFELVVIDDGSSDATGEIVASVGDGRVRLLRQENRGAAAARNRGVSAARGTLVSFLDSDDLFMPDYLQVMRAAMEGAPDAGLAYTDAWTLDDKSGRIGTQTAMQRQRPPLPPPADPPAFLLELLERNFIFTAVTVRREVLKQVGPFREELRAGIDYEMNLRIVARGYKAVCAPGLPAVYRQRRSGSIQSDWRRAATGVAAVYRIALEEYDLPPRARAVAEKQLAAAERELARAARVGGPGDLWYRRIRPVLVELRNRFTRDLWHPSPPAEIAAAFPHMREAEADRKIAPLKNVDG